MVDMLGLEKLLEHAAMVEKISEEVVDEQNYNAVTKSINESVSQNTDTDINKVISNGNKINDKVNLDLLESQVNGALGISESLDPVGEEDDDANNDGKVDDSDKYIKNKRKTITKKIEKENVMENATKIAKIPHNAGKPAVGVDTADKFQQAVAVKQSDFVNANTEHEVSKTADEKGVDKNADAAMKAMRKGADSEKKDAFPEGKQDVPSINEAENTAGGKVDADAPEVDEKGETKMRKGAASAISDSEVGKPNDEWKKGITAFKTFVESLKDGQNDAHMNVVLEAFDVISKLHR